MSATLAHRLRRLAAEPARLVSLSLGLTVAIACTGCGGARPSQANVDWPSWGNTAENTHFATLSQVNTTDVGRLRLSWTRPEGFGQFEWETFPVVVGTTMYYTTDTDEVLAVDARTGRLRWSYVPEVDFLLGPQGVDAVPVSRGVTVGGGRVYELTADDQLIALSSGGGKRLWDVRVADPDAGYSENSPGTYWDGEIIIGGPAGDAGLRGFVAAYAASSGRQLWRTYVIPPRGQGWLAGGGAHGGGDVWMPPTVDAASATVYVATGDPTPAFSNAQRKGCDRWSDATVALDARTGALEWGHSELCEDSWDYDTDQSPTLFDVHVNGRTVRALGDGNKSGFYSILDARSGSLLARSPELTRYSRPHRRPSRAGAIVCPGIFGGLEYGPPAYSPLSQSVYLPGTDMCMRYTVDSASAIERHRSGEPDLDGAAIQVGPATGVIAAVDASTGHVAWSRPLPRPATGGALATAGGLVFVGDDDGYLYALDARSGAILWRAHLGLRIGSAPIAYELAGVEYIAIAAGGSQLSVPGDAPPGEGRMFVFRLA
ncbi:MAG TPA: PQQ-binding-like beta-propeller repeat protein [Solirubrobacteraceae bacterium]|jgi:alcohol dehydrogenase (cytochrome c)|nr:PQQ-binding-like beta-propeller repeat protein [Solirubrobacteraceae bacterium]